MNTKTLVVCIVVAWMCTIGTMPLPAHAYGGGGGGTGVGGTVPSSHVECRTFTRQLPFGKTMIYPYCYVVHDTSFRERMRDFIGRLMHGAHGRTGGDR